MPKTKVYFSSLRADANANVLDRLEKLLLKSGMLSIDFARKFTALKIHFGEPGNLATLRPQYAARVVRLVKEAGGIPFVTDANTLYKGRRANAPDHLESAYENGYNPFSLGCHVIIADGLKGTDYRELPVDGKHFRAAKIGTAVADADVIITLSHFKGHEATGFGGAIKNVGMGSGSVGGKMEMHSSNKPLIERKNCVGCKLCVANCAHDAVHMGADNMAVIDYEKCVGCGQCIAVCRYDSAQVQWGGADTGERMAEYARAALNGKPSFHVNFIMDVSPNCDCWSHNDTPIVANIGILASPDPVALDAACADLVNAAPGLPGSAAEGSKAGEDKFRKIYPNVDWTATLAHAEKIGLGNRDYELVRV